MKNKLSDLNNHLFAALERLNDEDLTPEQIAVEADRAKAMVAVSDQIVAAASLELDAVKLVAQHGGRFGTFLPETINARIEHNPTPKTPEQLEREAVELRRRQSEAGA